MEIIKWEVDGFVLIFILKGKISVVFQKFISKGEEGIEEGGVFGVLFIVREILYFDVLFLEEKFVNEVLKFITYFKVMEEISSKLCVWFKIKFEIQKVLCISICFFVFFFCIIIFVKDIGLIWFYFFIVDFKDIVYMYLYIS